ncbi:MAG: stage III sporulation protein AE [Acetivibrionales bacterium]|jgi:stage III sporulation protein AE
MNFILRNKILFSILVFLTVILSTTSVAASGKTEAESKMGEDIIEERLNNSEINTIKKAVDKALGKSQISKVYGFSPEEIISGALKGKPLESLEGLPKIILAILGKEIRVNLVLIVQLLAIMLLGAVIRGLQPLGSGIPNEAAKLGANGILIIVASVSFGSMADIARATIETMQYTASLVIPALIALMAASGRIISVAAIQPIMLVGVNIACQIFKTILLPVSVMAGILFLIDGISERFKLGTLAKLLKSCAVWITGTITLVFSILISIQKIASSSIDAVTLKTTRFAIGTFIPVAGKYMTDAAETILLCTSAVSNIAGVLTIIGLGLIFVIPFIKVYVIMIAFRLAAAFGAPICDESICDALEESAGCLSVMLGIMGASLFVIVLLTGALMNSAGVIS